MSRIGWTLGLAGGAAVGAVAAVWVAGAAWSALPIPLGPTAGAALAGAVGFALAVVGPLYVAGQVLALVGERRVHRPTITLGTVLALDGAVLAVAIGLAGPWTGAALRAHGDWFLAGHPAPVVAAVSERVADLVDPPATVADVAPAAEDVPPVAPAPAVPAPAPVEPEGPWTAKEVFAARSPSIVVLRVWSRPDGVESRIAEALGVAWAEGLGSGFAVGPDLVVTNYHVAGDAELAEVATPDGKEYGAIELLAADEANDLALVRVPGAALAPVPLGDAPEVGDKCFAIGAPLGMEQTLTEGIVSARRTLNGTDVLQTQTPIAPGSSGGPLLDDHGRVVGVTTATFGAGMNVAVARTHIDALLAAPRAAKVLGAAPAGYEVAEVVGDGSLLPTQREQIGKAAALVADATEPCWTAAGPPPPASARLELTVGMRIAVDATDLPDGPRACVEDRLRDAHLLGPMLMGALVEADAPVEVRFRWSGAGAAPPLTLRLTRGAMPF